MICVLLKVTHVEFAYLLVLNVCIAVFFSLRKPPLPPHLAFTDFGHVLEHCWAYEPANRPAISQLASAILQDDRSILNNPHCVLVFNPFRVSRAL